MKNNKKDNKKKLSDKKRERLVAKRASSLIEGGWSSIYLFVSSHITDEELLEYDN